MTALCFDDPALPRALEGLAPHELDELPFGVIRLDGDGRVLLFSRREAADSGFGDRPALGRDFLRDVAPCLDTADFRAELAAAAAQDRLDLELGHSGDFDDPDRFLRIRLCSATGGGCWLLIQREG